MPTASTSTSSRCRTRCRRPTPSSCATCAPRSARDAHLTVATTGGAATWDEGYDLAGLTAPGAADALMVMAYDLNWSGSARAGGVAPIDSPYTIDVRTAMADFRARVARRQLIWGVPVLRTRLDDDRRDRQRPHLQLHGQLHRGQLGVPLRRRGGGRRGQGPALGCHRPGAVVHVLEHDLRRARAGLLRRRRLARREARDGQGQRPARGGHLAPHDGRGAARAVGPAVAQLRRPARSATSTTPRFLEHIIWLAAEGITSGCGAERFCPLASVSRAEMASFLSRALDLTGGAVDAFTDDDGIQHELSHQPHRRGRDHDRLRRVALLPDRDSSRAHRWRASWPAPSTCHRRRTTTSATTTASTHEDAINRLAEAGIASGCTSSRLLPDRPRQPRADGGLPASRARPLGASRNRSAHLVRARSAYGRAGAPP